MNALRDLMASKNALLQGGYSPNPEIIDRASLLPIGQYEDGSLTLAWPGFMKDAAEGGVRSLVGQEGAPLYDDGGQYVSGASYTPADTVNFASAGPMAGVARKVAGALPSGAHGAAALAERGPTRTYHGTDQVFDRAEIGRTSSSGSPEGPLGFWSSDNPGTASVFADWVSEGGQRPASVMPLDVDFKNPWVVDDYAAVQNLVGTHGADHAAARQSLLDKGHDGVVIRNTMKDSPDGRTPINQYVAIKPGTVRSATTGETLFANDSRAALPSLLGNALEQPKGIRAYHGSPHDFDQFDMSKIGTGEGAQAYGHGLYFAENEGVAKSYKEALEQPRKSLDPTKLDDPKYSPFANYPSEATEMAKGLLAKHDNNPSLAAKEATDLFFKGRDDTARLAANLIAFTAKHSDEVNKGRMYEVNIKADPEQFLDWDKPLAEQSEAVRTALEPIARSVAERLAASDGVTANKARAMGMSFTPQQVDPLSLTGQQLGNAPGLQEAGIPGIRYLDGGSRGAGEGSYNYVVNDASLIEILRKYGLLGTAGLGAGLLGDDGEANATGLLGR